MFSVKIDSLNPGTYYCIKAYARNAVGIGYSDSEKKCKTSLSVAEISTNNVSDITPTTAVCGGNITSDGGLQVTERGVCWSTSHNPTIYNNRTIDGSGIGNFTSNITGLTDGTTYYVRAYATNEMGTAYGEEKSFLTTSKPTVTTYPVTEISGTSAVCGGNVTSTGSSAIVARGVCWATHYNPTIEDDKTFDSVDTGSLFTSNITGLTEGTTYYVRAYATNGDGTSYGEERVFRTLSLPVVRTNAVTNISYGTATCGGNVSSDGGVSVTARGVCWSTSQNPTISNSKTIDGYGTGSFTSNITGLASGTTYYVRAYATNEDGTSYGEERVFRTLSLPIVSTNAVTNITYGTATCGGKVLAEVDMSVTARGVCWSTSQNPTISDSKTIDGSGTGSFTSNITGLASGTTYYVRAYATNSVGTAYGEVKQFTTNVVINPPTVQTNSATNVTTTGATISGNVISDGGANVTSRGFVYGTTISNLSQNIQNGSGLGPFTSMPTALASGTTYYYKAYATNSAGTSYGEVKQFTTISTPGTLNGHAWVDLGLPSGTKWATCNVGASTPTAYGNYYAWGETSTKSTYTEANYTYYTGNPTTLPSDKDAATANWGAGWRMPTMEEMHELLSICTHVWTTQNGVNGHLFTGQNGNSIFLPAAGYRYDSELYDACSYGFYWSGSLYMSDTDNAWVLNFDSGDYNVNISVRYGGFTVRAVCQ